MGGVVEDLGGGAEFGEAAGARAQATGVDLSKEMRERQRTTVP